MICYRDKTWCNFKDCANATHCPRVMSKEEEARCRKWSLEITEGKHDMIASFFGKHPKCYKEAK